MNKINKKSLLHPLIIERSFNYEQKSLKEYNLASFVQNILVTFKLNIMRSVYCAAMP